MTGDKIDGHHCISLLWSPLNFLVVPIDTVDLCETLYPYTYVLLESLKPFTAFKDGKNVLLGQHLSLPKDQKMPKSLYQKCFLGVST